MHLDAYTDDVICNAMGLGQFEPVGVERAIRLLVKPSFHPEACVTVEPTRLHVVALRSMLWHEPVPCRLPEYAEAMSVTCDQFQRVVEAFDRALAEHAKAGKCITIDGMPISALRIAGNQRSAFEGQPVGSEQAKFVGEVLRLAHASASSVHLRNRIAECGRYVDRTFTIEPEPELPNVTRVMVLGAPDERAEYFDKLQARTAPRPPT
jgi:hypothetical protein